MELGRKEIARRQIKSSEGEFIWELNNPYELSPKLSEQILITAKESLFREYHLSQNYPNPFNPITKISWQSPVSGWQTLKVFDILGNKVATLVNEYRPAGSYEIEFNPESSIKHPASGVYFYRLEVGYPSSGSVQVCVETKKMIYLK